ncbi:centrosomal protein of 68 kDa isoform X2 [Talpa occidentalis]|uniref:centrosomal protein of 68 kDa isoform X2 n=1 Tax=Talpa occidentalis TaxID=50954 RepID=UPI00188E74BA|nr:centrosomal protein of 68 kDa isoform X2 [Talpa occidentalis]
MALGEEKVEVAVEASKDTKAPSYGSWSCEEQEVDTPDPVSREQLPRLEAEGGPAFPAWGAEEPHVPASCSGAGLGGPYGACQPQGENFCKEPVAGGSKPALGCLLPPTGMGTADPHCVGNQMEETRTSASEELPQTLAVPRATALSPGHDADIEDDPSPVESPQVLDLSQQACISCFPFTSRWRSVVSPGVAAPQFSSCSISASSPGSSLQCHQGQAEPQGCSFAKVSSSSELVVPQSAPSVVGPGPPLQWSPQPVSSKDDVPGLGRRHLSFQAEYWACVLPDSLPPSPDRHSPLWNPNKEYEDLLDYTYPLRPRPQLPKHLNSHVLTDPVLQDSGVDLDSFSVSPASTLKSPSNVSHSCPPAEATTLPFSAPREPGLKQWPSRVSQKQGGRVLASSGQLASTPRASDSRDTSWESREPALRGVKDWLPMDKHLEVGSPQLRKWNRGWLSSRPGREKGASQCVRPSVCTKSGWKSEEEMESDEEYLALPTRLTQVSSLISYLGSIPTSVTLPSGAAEGQSSPDISDSDGPASLPSDSNQSQLRPGATLRVSRDPDNQNPPLPHSLVHAGDSAVDGSQVNSQALGISSRPLRTRSSLPAVSGQQAFSEPGAGREQGKESLVQCVKTFCCQLEELILWLYNVADITDHLTPLKSSLTGLKSSLQLYRQFKKDIDEHESLTESVLQKGEILLQCLLDNTPVLKDVLGRIAKQPSELESHADRLYDSILASLDLLAGCPLTPQHTGGTQEH